MGGPRARPVAEFVRVDALNDVGVWFALVIVNLGMVVSVKVHRKLRNQAFEEEKYISQKILFDPFFIAKTKMCDHN